MVISLSFSIYVRRYVKIEITHSQLCLFPSLLLAIYLKIWDVFPSLIRNFSLMMLEMGICDNMQRVWVGRDLYPTHQWVSAQAWTSSPHLSTQQAVILAVDASASAATATSALRSWSLHQSHPMSVPVSPDTFPQATPKLGIFQHQYQGNEPLCVQWLIGNLQAFQKG